MEGASDQLACPSCNREYELPRRYLIHLDDYDFSPIPRILPCLHSMCHSCLEEQYEKNSSHCIECSLCHHKEVIKGVNFLPLDLLSLKQVVNTTSTELLATCSRCYDIVPSVSWCETCSSALCEFHHQDHKLSVETCVGTGGIKKHKFATFKEYFYANQHIEYKFPPISCPEIPLQDCEYYCVNCYYCISGKAFIDHHVNHKIKSIDEIFPEMKATVSSSVFNSKKSTEKLQTKISKIKEFLNQLDENEENQLLEISKQFNLIYSHLRTREKELISNLTNSISLERQKLLKQLSNFVELVEEYEQVNKVGSSFISFSSISSSSSSSSSNSTSSE
jgi:Asp-tRNA(Asn)/Glu-tRNA(Gln) amidotransferase C subunit